MNAQEIPEGYWVALEAAEEVGEVVIHRIAAAVPARGRKSAAKKVSTSLARTFGTQTGDILYSPREWDDFKAGIKLA